MTSTQIVKPPASGIREVSGLEGSKKLELVKSFYGLGKNPPPRPLGQIEVPGLEELDYKAVVKSPEIKEKSPQKFPMVEKLLVNLNGISDLESENKCLSQKGLENELENPLKSENPKFLQKTTHPPFPPRPLGKMESQAWKKRN